MMISDLPLDLIDEILCKVPATPLKRLRSTCKRWNALFKDRRFSEKHFREAEKQSQVVMFKKTSVCSMSVNLNLDVAPPSIAFKGALSLKDSSHSNSEEVDIAQVSHCDGLLLCTTKDDRLVVWNPCLRETRWIQHDKTGHSRFALGYIDNKSCRRYKILRCWSRNEHIPKDRFEIYELSSDSWKVLNKIPLDCFMLLLPNPVSSKENTFWLALDENRTHISILSFDFTKERFKRLFLPQFQNPGYTRALSLIREEHLSVINQCFASEKMEIWVTNKFDTEAALTWRKSFTVDFQNICLNGRPVFVSYLIDEEKKVVLCCDANFEVGMKMVYTIGEDDEYYTKIPYVEDSTKKSWPFIFSYVPSLVQLHQDRDK